MEEILALSEKSITLSRNEFLVEKGKIDKDVYFVEKGCLRAYVLFDGQEQNIRFGYKDNFMVSLDSFFTGRNTEFYIQALKKTKVRVISRDKLELYLMNDQNKVQWISLIENLVVQQMEREIDLLVNSPTDRCQRVLKRSPQLFQEVPNKHIANYLRMSPETLSRIKKY